MSAFSADGPCAAHPFALYAAPTRHTPLLVALLLFSGSAIGVELGATLGQVALRTADDKPSTIPHLGELVLVLFYTDADVADMNDPLADALTASTINADFYEGLGVVNLHDSKAPNFIIRSVLQDKTEKYDSLVLTDPDLALPRAWGLGGCNNTRS